MNKYIFIYLFVYLHAHIERLNQVAEKCKEKGAECVLLIIDISNIEELTRILENFDDSHPIELLFSNAGIYIHIKY